MLRTKGNDAGAARGRASLSSFSALSESLWVSDRPHSTADAFLPVHTCTFSLRAAPLCSRCNRCNETIDDVADYNKIVNDDVVDFLCLVLTLGNLLCVFH